LSAAEPSRVRGTRQPFSPARQALVLTVLGAALFFVGLGSLPLVEPDEGRNSEVGREMLASGDWTTPHYDTLPYLDKPAVFFWLEAASFRIAGVSEWAARFPSALAALGTLLLTWFLAGRMFAGAAALRAGIVFATCPLVIILARLAIFDMTLVLFITVALVCYWMARSPRREKRLMWEAGFFAGMGLASITKGPVGFILPLLTVVAFEVARGRPGELKRIGWLSGLAVFFLIALPWFIAVSLRNPGFPRYAFWEESLVRFTAGGVRRGGSLFYYIPVYFGGLLPWSLFLLLAAVNRVSRWKELRDERQAPVLYLLVWSAVVLVFFSISHSKLPAYILPACVPLSLLMARAWSELDYATRAPDWLTAGFAALMALGLVTALVFWLPFHFAWLERLSATKMSPQTLVHVRPSLAYTGLILTGWGILGRKLASSWGRRGIPSFTLAIAALVAPSVFLRWARPIRTYAEFASSRELARTILSSPQKDLTVYGYYYFRTSLPFYLKRPVGLVTGGGGELTSNYIASRLETERSGEAARELLLDYQSFYSKAQTSAQPFLVLARNSHVASLGKATGRAEDLTPLWTEWQDSVWEVPAASLPPQVRTAPGP
jgi:4-amino-4-deoxy-L-arabinose transferase-like glycosyltransferase